MCCQRNFEVEDGVLLAGESIVGWKLLDRAIGWEREVTLISPYYGMTYEPGYVVGTADARDPFDPEDQSGIHVFLRRGDALDTMGRSKGSFVAVPVACLREDLKMAGMWDESDVLQAVYRKVYFSTTMYKLACDANYMY